MRSRVTFFILLFVAGSLALPLAAHAGGIPFFGPVIPPENPLCPAGWGMLMLVINNIISLLLTLAIVFVAPLMIAWSGFLFVVNPVNSEGISTAKKILTHTVVGIVVALAGWLIVDALMAAIYNKDAKIEGGTLGVWSSLITTGGAPQCLDQKGTEAGAVPTTAAPPSVSAAPGAGGVCTAPSSGDCTVASLQNRCFASNAGQAAQICGQESAGIANKLSVSDKTADGKSYSVGLFQINLTNSYSTQVDGQSCANAFTQPCQNSGGYSNVQPSGACSSSVKTGSCGAVSCAQLYTDCVASALDPNNNISQACRLSGNGSNWSPWRNVATTCGLILR